MAWRPRAWQERGSPTLLNKAGASPTPTRELCLLVTAAAASVTFSPGTRPHAKVGLADRPLPPPRSRPRHPEGGSGCGCCGRCSRGAPSHPSTAGSPQPERGVSGREVSSAETNKQKRKWGKWMFPWAGVCRWSQICQLSSILTGTGRGS